MKRVVKPYQEDICTSLREIFSMTDAPVLSEWSTMQHNRTMYSPIIDIAVGPFSIERGINLSKVYDELLEKHKSFVSGCISYHQININQFQTEIDIDSQQRMDIPTIRSFKRFNRNARCFIAIEIENKVSRKHLLGGAVNACAQGRIGVLVGWDADKLKSLIKLQRYWSYLGRVEKNTFQTENLLILSPDQLKTCCKNSIKTI